MGKIKLNLVSGAVVEKPLVSAFSGNNSKYVVLDNEMNGSMGLPIILVSKLENDKLVKIVDQNEWQVVKEYLKNIIAGNKVDFISVNNEISADDIYYTQLTLPVPSFDSLKKSYNIEPAGVQTQEIVTEANSVTPSSNLEAPAPVPEPVPELASTESALMPNIAQVEPVMPSVEPVSSPTVETPAEPSPVVMPNVEVQDSSVNMPQPEVSSVTEPIMPQVEDPILNNPLLEQTTPESAPDVSIMDAPIGNISNTNDQIVKEPVVNAVNGNANIEPEVTPTPIIEADIPVDNSDIFKEQKEAFMQACENMFDALVQKFEKELENHK